MNIHITSTTMMVMKFITTIVMDVTICIGSTTHVVAKP
jgi:hypothetical protein